MFEKDSFKFSLPMLLLLLLLLLQTTGLNSSVHSCCLAILLDNDAVAASAVDMFIIFPRKVRHKNNCAAVVVVVVFIFLFSFKVFCFLNCELFTSILSQFAIVTTIIGIPYFTTVKRVSDQVL